MAGPALGEIVQLESGWRLVARLLPERKGGEPGGYVLNDIIHHDYWFAKEIRIARILLFPEVGEPVSVTLGNDQMPILGTAHREDMTTSTSRTVPLGEYKPSMALKAEFATDQLNQIGGKLKIVQEYLFTKYSNTPAHEPTGKLFAARFYPLLSFRFEPKDRTSSHILREIRFDFKLRLSLDQLVYRLTGRQHGAKNQAAVFKDKHTVSKIGAAVDGLKAVFLDAEKPLVHEILGKGLEGGSDSTWDNIHFWSYDDNPPEDVPRKDDSITHRAPFFSYGLPSTPGAFHCVHSHWRWTQAALDVAKEKLKISGQQFLGVGGIGGPLIDKRLRDQDISFAITSESQKAALDPKAVRDDFASLFKNDREPARIEPGDLLTVWISITVRRNLREKYLPWEGTVFEHGLYFAHDVEPYPRQLSGDPEEDTQNKIARNRLVTTEELQPPKWDRKGINRLKESRH